MCTPMPTSNMCTLIPTPWGEHVHTDACTWSEHVPYPWGEHVHTNPYPGDKHLHTDPHPRDEHVHTDSYTGHMHTDIYPHAVYSPIPLGEQAVTQFIRALNGPSEN